MRQGLVAFISFLQHTHMAGIIKHMNVRFSGQMTLLQHVFYRNSIVVFAHDKKHLNSTGFQNIGPVGPLHHGLVVGNE